MRDALKRGRTFIVNVELTDGRIIDVVNQPIKGGGWVATHEDIRERRKAERELEHTRAFLNTIIENVPSPIIVKSVPDLNYLLINRAAEKYLGVDRASMLGKTARDIFATVTAEMIEAEDCKVIESGTSVFLDEHTVFTPGNGTRIVIATRLPVLGADGKPQYLISVIRDLTERRRHEQQIAHMAHHDPLTDLPNRTAFNECIAATLALAKTSEEKFALLSIDLDRFKTVNDVFGHKVGDALLREVASRMEQAGQGAFIARVGGDEFHVITPTGPQPETAEALAEKLCAALDSDIDIDGIPLRVRLTVGIAIFPQDGVDVVTLIANADAALFRAKSEARGSIRFFELSMDKQLRDKRALQQDLRTAIVRGEVELYYQPQAHISGEVTGFEALVRWHHPRHGLVSPSVFIPLAEESGIIVELGEWILRTACRQAASWLRPLNIAINLSPVQFRYGDLPKLVHEILLETGPVAAAPRARDHRGRADRRFQPRGLHPAPAESARRAHRHGRFRHRLFVAVLFAVVPVRQDQDRSVLHRQSRPQPAGGHHRARGDRARPRAQYAGGGGGRGDRGTAQIPRRRILQRDPGLLRRPAEADRGLRGIGRASGRAAPAARRCELISAD